MQMRKLIIVGLILLTASVGLAQSAKLKGKVLDSSGLIMPGVAVKVYQGTNVVKEGTTTATGDFEFAVNPGDYTLEVSADDFETHKEAVKATANFAPLTISMTLAVLATNVDVVEDAGAVSLDADSSLSTTTLKGDTLTELPDDEDELAAYLEQIAGSRGGSERGGGSGGFVIDGFSGGRLPPKDQIQEIRINNNPYSTEFGGIGFGRIEIVTRAGTGNFNGNMQFNFKDESLDARNPNQFTRPPYQTRNFNTNYGGPIIKNKLTMNFRANNNENENAGGINAHLADGSIFNQSYTSPNVNRGFNTRAQYALTRNNTLNLNYNYNSGSRKNQIGNEFTLPERASDSKNSNYELQVRETAIFNPKLVHEVRFEAQHSTNSTTPRTNAITINVLEAFNSGGGQNRSSGDNWNYEFGNLLMYSTPKLTSKTGIQINAVRNHSESFNNYRGMYQFPSLTAYLLGQPTQFTQTTGNPILDSRQTEFGSFWQNDWKISPRFSFYGGVRYQAQTNLKDYNNIDPRVGFAIGLTKTASIRGGAGIFHQTFGINNVETLLRRDGTRQLNLIVTSPFFDSAWIVDPSLIAVPTAVATAPSSISVRSEDLATPYNINTSIALEKSWSPVFGTTFAWDTTRGVHLLRSRNINAPFPGTALPEDLQNRLNSRDADIKAAAVDEVNQLRPMYPYVANVNQLESTGRSRSNNFNIGFRANVPRAWSLFVFGSYGLGFNKSDTDGAFSTPVNSYNLADEWSRSQNDTRHRFNTGVNLRIPSHLQPGFFGRLWNYSMGNTFMMINMNATSARPYNITTGKDNNGDTTTNDRPAGLSRNAGIGPSNYNVNLNFNKQFTLKKESSGGGSVAAASPYMASFAEPQRGGGGPGGPGGGGQRGPGPGGGGPRGGGVLGGGGGRGPGGRGQQPNKTVTFSANINNVLNHTQPQNFSGVLGSNDINLPLNSSFGRPTRFANGRSINLGLRFNF
jgi:hypothetical protein